MYKSVLPWSRTVPRPVARLCNRQGLCLLRTKSHGKGYSGIFEDRSRRLITRPLFGTLRRQNDRSTRDSRNLIDLWPKMFAQHCDGRCPNPSIHEYVSSCNGPSRIDPRGSLPSCIDPQGSLESRTQISGQSAAAELWAQGSGAPPPG